jgi:hypothetical protein
VRTRLSLRKRPIQAGVWRGQSQSVTGADQLSVFAWRCFSTKALVPVPSKPTGSFVQDVCDGRPDLYGACASPRSVMSQTFAGHATPGVVRFPLMPHADHLPRPLSPCPRIAFSRIVGPFWSLTTLAFTLYVCSSLSSSVLAYMANPDAPAVQDIGRISLACALVYTYGLGWPAVLWGVVRWFGGAEVEWSLVEAWTVYGCQSLLHRRHTPLTLLADINPTRSPTSGSMSAGQKLVG